MRVSEVEPAGLSSYTGSNGEPVEKVVDFGVQYSWSIAGIDLEKCICGVDVNSNYGVCDVVYDEPAVKVVGEQRVRVSPEMAINAFLRGRCINGIIGATGPIYWPQWSGTLTIDDARLVYYPVKSPDGRVEEALVYKISYHTDYVP